MANPSEYERLMTEIESDTIPNYALIGRLITEFARAEAYIHLLATRMAGMEQDRASLIFSGMRMSDVATIIRSMALYDSLEKEEFSDIDACLVQLELVGRERNKLAHRFVSISADKIEASNHYTAKTPEHVLSDEYTADMMQNMISDCIRIRERIWRHTDGEGRRNKSAERMAYLFGPWRHVPLPAAPKK